VERRTDSVTGPTNDETGGGAVLDVHAHVVPPSLLAELADGSTKTQGFSADRTDKGWVVTVPGAGPTRPVGARMTDPGPRREWMARTGVTGQVLSPWMDVQSGDLSPAAAKDWTRRLNDAMAESAAALGGGTRVLATVPTCDGESAAAGVREVRARPEVAGVLLNTAPGEGLALHDPAFEPFWAAAEQDGVPVMLHPPTCGPSGALPTLGGMGNVHGRLIDNTLAVTELILHGVLDRYPRLVLILVHGGGFLPYQAARLDGGYRTRESFAGELARERPSAYLSDLYYDTAALSGPAIAFLAGLVGADRVLLGSDYPFALSDPEPVRTVRDAGLRPEETAAILGANAGTILGSFE
jgi:aminocarboxymuconate-semialdehyde decarboxylase